MKPLSVYCIQTFRQLKCITSQLSSLAFMQWEKIQMSEFMFCDSAAISSVPGSHTVSFCNLGQATSSLTLPSVKNFPSLHLLFYPSSLYCKHYPTYLCSAHQWRKVAPGSPWALVELRGNIWAIKTCHFLISAYSPLTCPLDVFQSFAKVETKALIRMYLLSLSLATGSRNKELSVLKDWEQMLCQWGARLQRENWSHELPGSYCKEWNSVYSLQHSLSRFLPAGVLRIGGRTQKTHFLPSPCVSHVELLWDTFLLLVPEALPPARHLQVQIKEGEGGILPKGLSLHPQRGYTMWDTMRYLLHLCHW